MRLGFSGGHLFVFLGVFLGVFLVFSLFFLFSLFFSFGLSLGFSLFFIVFHCFSLIFFVFPYFLCLSLFFLCFVLDHPLLDHPCGLQICDMFSSLRVKLRDSDGGERQRAVTVARPWMGCGSRRTQNPKTLLNAGGLGVRAPSPLSGMALTPACACKLQIASCKP